MLQRWGVVAGLAAVLQAVLAHAACAEALAEASPPPVQPPTPPSPPGPRVLLQADSRNARLQQFASQTWRDVCPVPCGVTVDPAGTYRVNGASVIVSDSFTLPRASGDLTVDADVASKGKRWAGMGLMIGGAPTLFYGLFFWHLADDSSNATNPDADKARTVGMVLTGLGAVLEIVGALMVSSRTSVRVR